MTLFEDEIQKIVDRMESIQVNPSVVKAPKFDWGETKELHKFIQAKGEESTPLVWSVNRLDVETEYGSWRRNAEFNFCHVETRIDKLNTERIKEGYSFKQVLSPMWEDFKKKLKTSHTMTIKKGSVQIIKYPDYTVGGKYTQNAIWDILKVRATIEFNEPCGVCCN